MQARHELLFFLPWVENSILDGRPEATRTRQTLTADATAEELCRRAAAELAHRVR